MPLFRVFAMNATVTKYLRSRSLHLYRPVLGSVPLDKLRVVVVIPALAERDHLFETLSSLASSSEGVQAGTLIIVVVNNQEPPRTAPNQLKNNLETLELLRSRQHRTRLGCLNLAWIDAATPGQALPGNEGVGFARKLGLDHGLHLLAENGRERSVLVSMDADAPPARGYLDALAAFYARDDRWAGYAAYLHTCPEGGNQVELITAHEIYMRYHEMGLRYAGSPYAYPALGSIISCTPKAYAAAGGMNRRLAGEDFYFMQQLTKTGSIEPVPYALVFPSGRISARTPFGTGRSVAGYQFDSSLDINLPQIRCFKFLRQLFDLIRNNADRSGSELTALSLAIHPELTAFLEKNRFQDTWQALTRHHPDRNRRIAQFHTWFDGLRTIQFLHHFRDSGFPEIPARAALPQLFDALSMVRTDSSGMDFLNTLREIGLRRHILPGAPPPPYSPEVFLRLPATS